MNEEIKNEFGKKINELKNYLDIDIEEPSRDLECKDEELNNEEIFKRYYFSNIERFHEEAKIGLESINKFIEEYPLARLKDISLEEYALGAENKKESLSYKLEFGKYRTFLGIKGGSSDKHGVYWKNHGSDLFVAGEIYPKDVGIEKWDGFRSELYSYLKEYESAEEPINREKKYPLLKSMNMVLVKLLVAYYPQKFIPIANKGKLRDLLDYFEFKYENDMQTEELNFILTKSMREKFDFLKDTDSGIIGSALWHFVNEVIYADELPPMLPTAEEIDPYTKEDFLKKVYISENQYDDIVAILNTKKNIILQGAPGVGKTYMARRLAYSLMGCKDKNRIKFVQFHQSYSYEDFIEGYRPTETGFKLEKGIFYYLCEDARKDSMKNYYLIIDEINRGNLSKIFGELLMLIESDKRGKEHEIDLLYSPERFSVPENLYIIGLMNTADRSLAIIDYALRRRFSFVQVLPAYDSPKFIEDFNNNFNGPYTEVMGVIKELNQDIKNDPSLGEGFEIGHSYFCLEKMSDGRKHDKFDVARILQYEIRPLITEYWFDDEKMRNKWTDKLDSLIKGVKE